MGSKVCGRLEVGKTVGLTFPTINTAIGEVHMFIFHMLAKFAQKFHLLRAMYTFKLLQIGRIVVMFLLNWSHGHPPPESRPWRLLGVKHLELAKYNGVLHCQQFPLRMSYHFDHKVSQPHNVSQGVKSEITDCWVFGKGVSVQITAFDSETIAANGNVVKTCAESESVRF